MPSMGVNWDVTGSGSRANGVLEITDAALAARQRVERALEAVGPELSGVLIDVCCFLKGLEVVERERQWPVRSAKLILKTALAVLDRHYHPAPPTRRRPRIIHWKPRTTGLVSMAARTNVALEWIYFCDI